MGHIKIAKAGGKFDVVSADNVLSVKETNTNDDIQIVYTSGYGAVIAASGALGDDDVFAVTKAIDVMDGTSGPAPLLKLSSLVTGVNGAAVLVP
jgi:hypothetical protein